MVKKKVLFYPKRPRDEMGNGVVKSADGTGACPPVEDAAVRCPAVPREIFIQLAL